MEIFKSCINASSWEKNELAYSCFGSSLTWWNKQENLRNSKSRITANSCTSRRQNELVDSWKAESISTPCGRAVAGGIQIQSPDKNSIPN
jgi:hypothetical protein